MLPIFDLAILTKRVIKTKVINLCKNQCSYLKQLALSITFNALSQGNGLVRTVAWNRLKLYWLSMLLKICTAPLFKITAHTHHPPNILSLFFRNIPDRVAKAAT